MESRHNEQERGLSKVKLTSSTKVRPLDKCDDTKLEWSSMTFLVSAMSLYINILHLQPQRQHQGYH